MNSQHSHAVRWSPTMSTANNGISVLFNSTYTVGQAPSSTVVGTVSGRYIGGWVVIGHIYCTGQNVTVSVKRLVNGAWVAENTNEVPKDDNGNTLADGATLTASTVYGPYKWYQSDEKQLYITNGATGPTIHVARIAWYPGGS